jgi:hypothetical protein
MTTMVKLQTMIIVVLCVVIVALAAVLFVVYNSPAAPATSAPTGNAVSTPAQRAAPPATTRPTTTTQQTPVSPELNRYLQDAPISKDAPTMRTERHAQEDKMARLKELQARFKEISGPGKTPDIDELDQLLGELIDIQGTAVIGGVDLNVLRENLQVAQEVQALAKELEIESKRPSPDQNRILEITKEIQAMQGRLKTNILAGGAPGNPPMPPAVDTQKE